MSQAISSKTYKDAMFHIHSWWLYLALILFIEDRILEILWASFRHTFGELLHTPSSPVSTMHHMPADLFMFCWFYSAEISHFVWVNNSPFVGYKVMPWEKLLIFPGGFTWLHKHLPYQWNCIFSSAGRGLFLHSLPESSYVPLHADAQEKVLINEGENNDSESGT